MAALPDGIITVPHNRKAEEMIIGSILIDPTLLRKCELSVDDFYFEQLGMFYSIFLARHEDREPIDLVLLAPLLDSEDIATLNEYMSAAFTTVNFPYYESEVKELSIKRKIQKLGFSLSNMVSTQGISVDEIVSYIRGTVGQIVSGRGVSLMSMREMAQEIKSFVDRRRHSSGALSGIPAGLKDIDLFTDGWQKGDLIIVAGRPGTGKSAFAAHVAQHAASKEFPVGIISLEMGVHQWGIRSLSSLSNVEMWKLRRGIVGSPATYASILDGLKKMGDLPIWFSFSTSDAKSIEKAVTSLIEETNCQMIILDYMQLVRALNAESREREVAQVSSILKDVARTNSIPVMALSQLNRSPEKERRRPNLSDLRESGAIEQDADVVIFLHKGEIDGTIEVIFGKGRNIGTGDCKVVWNSETMTYRDYHEEGNA